MPRAGLDETYVLQTAASLADSLGAEAVTLAQLAKQLNVRPPSLYNHIKGLPDLREKLAIYGLQELHKKMKAAVEFCPEGQEAIYPILEAYVTFAEEHPGLYELAQGPQGPQIQEAGAPVVDLLLDQMSQRGIQGDQAIHAVRGLRSILHGFVSLSRSGGFGLPYAWKESLHYTIEAFLKGLTLIGAKE